MARAGIHLYPPGRMDIGHERIIYVIDLLVIQVGGLNLRLVTVLLIPEPDIELIFHILKLLNKFSIPVGRRLTGRRLLHPVRGINPVNPGIIELFCSMGRAFAAFCMLAVFASYSCHKGCHEQNYIFTSNDLFSPEKDSIRVGDTLILSCIIKKSQRLVYFSNAENLGGNLIISNIDSFNRPSRGAAADFSYFDIMGSLYTDANLNPTYGKQISFQELDSSYNLNVGLVATARGSYILTIEDQPGIFRAGSPGCGVANFIFANSNKNKHIYLFESQHDSLSIDDKIHSYCVKVY